MTDKEVMEKAIRKSIDGGWTPPLKDENLHISLERTASGYNIVYTIPSADGKGWKWKQWTPLLHEIFNHDFAKALWGEYRKTKYEDHYIPARGYPGESIPKKEIKVDSKEEKDWRCTRCGRKWARCFNERCNLLARGNYGWQYHLQQMVIAEDPIAYLAQHLPEAGDD